MKLLDGHGPFVFIGLSALMIVWQAGPQILQEFSPRAVLPPDAAAMERVFHDELALATGGGLRVIEDRRAPGPRVHHEVTLAPGECLSVIASAPGHEGVRELVLRDAEGTTLDGEVPLHYTNVVRHRQWCAPQGGRFTVDVASAVPPRVALLRGTATGPVHRVALDPVRQSQLYAELVRAAVTGDHAARAPVVSLTDPGRVLLLPSTPATRAALAAAVLPPDGTPLPALAEAPAAIAALDVADAPTPEAAPRVSPTMPWFRLLGDDLRVVAVVDRGALGAHCVSVRIASTHAASPVVWRSEVPGWATAPLPVTDDIAVDTACPAQGLVVYAVRREDPSREFLLSLGSMPAAPGAVATPSTWRGESVPHTLLTRLARDCATDARACLQLAHLPVHPRVAGPRSDFATLLRRACDLGDASACGRLGAYFLGGGRDVAQAATLLQRGCAGDDATACAILGEQRRRGDQGIAQDLTAAAAHLSAACRLGVPDACADRETLRRLRLGPLL